MARYGTQHKDATRRRILDAAGRRLKAHGVDGSGVSALMADAGLTNGAFYAHFASKDDLVAAVVADQLAAQREHLRSLGGAAPLVTYVRDYLSPGHRDSPDEGCPSAALLEEVGRGSAAVRAAYDSGLQGVVDDVLVQLGEGTSRTAVLGAMATMFGTLQLARALPDRDASDALLADGVEQVLGRLGVSGPGAPGPFRGQASAR